MDNLNDLSGGVVPTLYLSQTFNVQLLGTCLSSVDKKPFNSFTRYAIIG
jgi:hypothetical protein